MCGVSDSLSVKIFVINNPNQNLSVSVFRVTEDILINLCRFYSFLHVILFTVRCAVILNGIISSEFISVQISDCCIVSVGVVFNVVARFHCRSGILSGFNLRVVFLPKL